jgi:endonuclease YncB( thermonuclease family)
MQYFFAKRPANCVDLDSRSFKRTIALCTVAGIDLVDWLVRNGLALDWPKYSKGGYAAAQIEAKREGRGVWSGSFVEPWLYRNAGAQAEVYSLVPTIRMRTP